MTHVVSRLAAYQNGENALYCFGTERPMKIAFPLWMTIYQVIQTTVSEVSLFIPNNIVEYFICCQNEPGYTSKTFFYFFGRRAEANGCAYKGRLVALADILHLPTACAERIVYWSNGTPNFCMMCPVDSKVRKRSAHMSTCIEPHMHEVHS